MNILYVLKNYSNFTVKVIKSVSKAGALQDKDLSNSDKNKIILFYTNLYLVFNSTCSLNFIAFTLCSSPTRDKREREIRYTTAHWFLAPFSHSWEKGRGRGYIKLRNH